MSKLSTATWDRFRKLTATEADLRTILEEQSGNAAFEQKWGPVLWQMERQDMPDGRPVTMANAMAILASLARCCEAGAERNPRHYNRPRNDM